MKLADPTTRASWPPLAESTLLERALLNLNPAEILQRAGTLRRSVQTQTGPNFVEVGSAEDYALIHQFGGQAGREHGATIPARPFVGAHDEHLRSFEQIIRDFVLRR